MLGLAQGLELSCPTLNKLRRVTTGRLEVEGPCVSLEPSEVFALTIAATAVRAEPVAGVAGALVAPGVIVTVLLTAVRTSVTLVDI